MGNLVDPHESPVFEPTGAHERLYADRAFYSGLAGVRQEYLWQPLGGLACENEVKYISHIKSARDRGVYGILYVGQLPGKRLDAMVGALVRNFIDARLRTLEDALADDASGTCSVLFVPDFCVSADSAPHHTKSAVMRLLQRRLAAEQQTIVYAHTVAALAAAYGGAVKEHVSTHFMGDPRP